MREILTAWSTLPLASIKACSTDRSSQPLGSSSSQPSSFKAFLIISASFWRRCSWHRRVVKSFRVLKKNQGVNPPPSLLLIPKITHALVSLPPNPLVGDEDPFRAATFRIGVVGFVPVPPPPPAVGSVASLVCLSCASRILASNSWRRDRSQSTVKLSTVRVLGCSLRLPSSISASSNWNTIGTAGDVLHSTTRSGSTRRTRTSDREEERKKKRCKVIRKRNYCGMPERQRRGE